MTALAAPSRRRVGSVAARHATAARVCFISSEYPPRIHGGLGIHVTALTTALEFEDWLKILCSSLSLDDHVEFLGWQGQTELPSLVQNAAAIVVPSIFEPFGMVALEAFACKRPVIASRVGGLREIVQHGKSGFLAEPRDHLDPAQWIMAILFDADQCRRRRGRIQPVVSRALYMGFNRARIHQSL